MPGGNPRIDERPDQGGFRRRNPPRSLAELAAKMDRLSMPCPATGCYLWLGTIKSEAAPYGRIYFRGAMRGAHRIAWELKNGPIEVGMDVCHRCDNPLCVNPDHLFMAVHERNVADMMAKGRNVAPPRNHVPRDQRGEKNALARLTDAMVRDIRASQEPIRAIAKRLGIGRATVQGAKSGRTWTHVQ